MECLRFDNASEWEDSLALALEPVVGQAVRDKIAKQRGRYIEDAARVLFNHADRSTVIQMTIDWIESRCIAGYHGTRLTESEVRSVRDNGLIPLKIGSRVTRITRALSPHRDWPTRERVLIDAIASDQVGPQANRENQVHLTLSRSALVNGFNHYLRYGSEYDYNLTSRLFGDSGLDLLAKDGSPFVICVCVPGREALLAANPYRHQSEWLASGEPIGLVDCFLEVWAHRIVEPRFNPSDCNYDIGMIFGQAVPKDWIAGFEPWS